MNKNKRTERFRILELMYLSKKLFLLTSIALIISCAPTKITTTNLHDLASFEEGGDIYALPQTRLMYTVTVVKSNFTPGPYCDYAKKYLGLDQVQKLPKNNWQIAKLDLSRITEPDPDHIYSVKAEGKLSFSAELEGLRKDGLLLLPASLQSYQLEHNQNLKPVIELKHTDLSVKPFYKNTGKSKTNQPKENINTRLPVYASDLKAKTTEEKAAEAAAFIIKIRKRRFKLLAGQYEVFPEGKALETSVRELNKLEEDYLALFIGTVETDTLYKSYSFIPDENEKIQRTTLFKFSESEGLMAAESPRGESVFVEVVNLDKTSTLSQLQLPVSATSYTNIVFYRLPDKANVKVIRGSHLMHESEIPVCQFGALIPKYYESKKNTIRQK